MKQRSLFFSVVFIGIVGFLSIVILFSFFVKEDRKKHVDNLFERYQIIRSILLSNKTPMTNKNFERQFEQFNMKIIEKTDEKKTIVKRAKVLKTDKRKLVTQTVVPAVNLYISQQEVKLNIAMLQQGKNIYFYLRTSFGDLLIQDIKSRPYNFVLVFIPFVIVAILQIIIFTFLLVRLYPLRSIATTLKKFGDGDRNVRLAIKGNNETAEISDAFNSAVAQIDALIENRTLFMRNVMHELKTPIAKGRILSQVLDEKNQMRFDKLFLRLQNLLDDFALIDQVNSFLNLDITVAYSFRDILDEAIDMSMIEEEKITIIENGTIKKEVDYTLYATVFKNLLDNAIKYSVDNKVTVMIDNGTIDFISKGEKLKEDLSYYTQAFTSGERKEGFGLGLYIVQSILTKHHQTLNYTHKGIESHFSIQI